MLPLGTANRLLLKSEARNAAACWLRICRHSMFVIYVMNTAVSKKLTEFVVLGSTHISLNKANLNLVVLSSQLNLDNNFKRSFMLCNGTFLIDKYD